MMKQTVKSMMGRLFTNYCVSFMGMCGRNLASLEKLAFKKMPHRRWYVTGAV